MANIISSQPQLSDAQILDKWKVWKRESFDQRWIFERQWMRNVWYVLNRQWITFDTKRGQWVDTRLAKWVPKPVTPLVKDAITAVRASFAKVNYGATARPNGNSRSNIIAAGVADDYAPILHDDHRMDDVMNEADFWMLTCGNAWLHTCVDYSHQNGQITIEYEQCVTCGEQYRPDELVASKQKCPSCGGAQFQPAVNEDGSPRTETKNRPKGITIPLSPFELAYPMIYERFSMAPYAIRLRWRDKSYYEQHPELSAMAKTLPFAKSPADRTMQIFKTLPFSNDLGVSPAYYGVGGSAQGGENEGIAEYDIWVKPCEEFPEGQVIRIAGDNQPVVIHSELENLPGPLPYHDATGNPIFPFTHMRYESIGGRSLGSALNDPIIQKQDTLNQIDSLMLMIIMRVANPIWLEPKGAEVEKFTGEPGLVVKWNPLVAGGNAKPERIPGENIPASLFTYRNQIKAEIQELSGTYDILKGAQPGGVDAFSTTNLLLEQAQSRHTSAFKSRGDAYKDWFKFALEIEREFGDETRTKAVMGPNKSWAFETFKKADLNGAVDIIIEDGTLTPKTLLGERAAVEHLNQLQMLNPQDPEQVRAVYELFGQTKLLPSLDAQVQEAWRVFEAFEKLMKDGMDDPNLGLQVKQLVAAGASPLAYKRWYNPTIHRQEFLKWAVTDRARELFGTVPGAEQLADQYLATIDAALMMQAMGQLDSNGLPMAQTTGKGKAAGGPQGGAGNAMANSNTNTAGSGDQASGAAGAGDQMNEAR